MDTGRKDTVQLQDSQKGGRGMEWEGTKEAPTMVSNLFKKKKDLKQILLNIWNSEIWMITN